jgi:hypothetical protein
LIILFIESIYDLQVLIQSIYYPQVLIQSINYPQFWFNLFFEFSLFVQKIFCYLFFSVMDFILDAGSARLKLSSNHLI